ncbi:hypothetical protein CAP35_05160 [Chitinophagaceae bacterium IBVUCB1]|nr:hypothetical protein CAP35_05160 [Chitinophagaceae bacterium IBVUCB1]
MQSPKYLLTAACIYMASIASAQTRQSVDIKHATVFLNGAELSSTAKISLPQGESEILFTNIAGNVNQQSLNIGADNGVVIQSATFQNNFLVAEVLSPRARAIQDSIDKITDSRSSAQNMLSVTNEQIGILSQNKQVSGTQSGLSVAELTKMLDLVKNRLAGLLAEKDKLNLTLRKSDEHLALLNMQLEEEKRKDFQPGGQLLVKFYSPRATNTDINISYVVPNAGWSPSYDLRVDDLKSPVKLFYKANVYQNSGVKWDKVKISLSTGNPSEGAQAPALQPWYLAFYQPVSYGEGYINSYQNQAVPRAKALMEVAASEDAKAPAAGALNNYVQIDNSGINTTFDIDLPYTIPTDGQSHLVAVKSYELPATYRYYAVPKMDRDAFLQAQVTNWEDLNLIPAATNIFYEGSYVGQGYIDMRNTKDTMNISLGRDKKIIVRRERDKELRSVKTVGTNIRETFVYTVSIRNTRKEAVNITVLEQLPISNDKDIVIEDTDTDSGTLEETTGEVKWTLNVKPAETVKKKIAFTVKYPKGKTINL